jgi:hypothetical protein
MSARRALQSLRPRLFRVEFFAADLFQGGQIGLRQLHGLAVPRRSGARGPHPTHVVFVTQYLQVAPASRACRTILAWPAYDAARESEMVDSAA